MSKHVSADVRCDRCGWVDPMGAEADALLPEGWGVAMIPYRDQGIGNEVRQRAFELCPQCRREIVCWLQKGERFKQETQVE